mgnify:CR=1 FL=1
MLMLLLTVVLTFSLSGCPASLFQCVQQNWQSTPKARDGGEREMVNDTSELFCNYNYFGPSRRTFFYFPLYSKKVGAPEWVALLPLKSLSASQWVTNLNTQLFAFNWICLLPTNARYIAGRWCYHSPSSPSSWHPHWCIAPIANGRLTEWTAKPTVIEKRAGRQTHTHTHGQIVPHAVTWRQQHTVWYYWQMHYL